MQVFIRDCFYYISEISAVLFVNWCHFNGISCRNVHSRSAGRHVIEMLREHGTYQTLLTLKLINNKSMAQVGLESAPKVIYTCI